MSKDNYEYFKEEDSFQEHHADLNWPKPAHALSCSTGYVPTKWLKNQAIHYRAEAERNPTAFREYRRMAWACELVVEIWEEEPLSPVDDGAE